MRRSAQAPVRITAAATLLALLVALPFAVVTMVGRPRWSAMSAALGTGRIDDAAIVSIGTALFLGLWIWFAITAIAETARVVVWQSGRSARGLPATGSSPSDVVKRLVRAALISTTVAATSAAPLLHHGPGALAYGNGVATASAAGPARTGDTAFGVTAFGDNRDAVGSVRSSGRETPYSVAVRLGDPLLRDQIIELNTGRLTPSGRGWSGGVFPAGMEVEVPPGAAVPRTVSWTSYTVVAGDSVYQIAARLAERLPDGDGARVRDLADQILERNLGKRMNDGAMFDDASLIRPGWTLYLPDAAPDARPDARPDVVEGRAPATFAHVVERGDSYWSIAETHLELTGSTTPHDVALFSDALVDANAPVLGHSIDTLLVPGDTVRWDAPDAAPAPAADLPAPTTAQPSVEVASFPPPAPSTASAPSTLPATTTLAAPSSLPAMSTAATTARNGTTNGTATGTITTASPISRDLAAATLLCAGAIGLIESRRRRVLRGATSLTKLTAPPPTAVATERVIRSLDASRRAVRLDLALRNAGHALGQTVGHVLAAVMLADGEVTLVLDRPGRMPTAPWSSTADPAAWRLAAAIADEELVADARLAGQPCPTLVQLGTIVSATTTPGIVGGELFVDLEAFGMVCLDGPAAATTDIIRGLVASLQLSPIGQLVNLVGHSLPGTDDGCTEPIVLGSTPIEQAASLDEALDRAAVMLGSTPTAIGGRRTFELRARGAGGESWEPAVLISGAVGHNPDVLRELVSATRGGGRGLAVVLAGAVEGASLTLTAAGDGWVLERLGVSIVPVGLASADREALTEVLAISADVVPLTRPQELIAAPPAMEVADAPWELLVRVLGAVEVVTRSGEPVAFERGKALELVAWLSQHRERPTRSSARTALWELAVRDATFANVVSDARRAMARALTPPVNEEWIERTLTEDLPLHPLVLSDAELLRSRLQACAGRDAQQVIDALRPALAHVAGMPFAATNYLWPDAEGVSSALTMLVTSAATECARCGLELDDIDTVFWATGQGLKVLPGHEELIGLRMRAHAQRGDQAGVRREFESYERALHADLWSDEEPAPKLVELRHELLAQRVRTIA